MIKLCNVGKSYGDLEVLNGIDLEINEGEIYGFVGLSGAGKSTLLRLLNGLEKSSSGEIIYSKEIKFGFVFQNFNLVNSLTVYENIGLGLINDNLDQTQIDNIINDVLNKVGLIDKINSYPGSLSGGQKQRVGIARSLALGCNVLLCDEATSALDPFTANEIINLLKELNESTSLTIVFVSHQLEIIKDFCDHISIIDEGKLCETGLVRDVFSNPKSEITKKLLTNILEVDYSKNPLVFYDNSYLKEVEHYSIIKYFTSKQGEFIYVW